MINKSSVVSRLKIDYSNYKSTEFGANRKEERKEESMGELKKTQSCRGRKGHGRMGELSPEKVDGGREVELITFQRNGPFKDSDSCFPCLDLLEFIFMEYILMCIYIPEH
ncbi:hypothetical protein CEXT_567211 [Caerostris extrusa]|uniref:Uncharacterized protein n=1 Tax=Caerostris extrusa TaxID=172846 RepID=A0AAV4QG19_CAEEX|nr:hypothetical protein CEXT_567211 [Caerostris extrusa]